MPQYYSATTEQKIKLRLKKPPGDKLENTKFLLFRARYPPVIVYLPKLGEVLATSKKSQVFPAKRKALVLFLRVTAYLAYPKLPVIQRSQLFQE
jgi:hypothetical protein